jgi:branched-chain amino acid transport system permease protein
MQATFIGGLVSVATYALVAVGFSLIFSVTKAFHFAHAVVYVLAGYVAYSVVAPLGVWAASVVGVAAAAATAAVIELVVYARMRRHRASHFTILIASLGLQYLILGVVGAIWGTYPLVLANPFVNLAPVHLGGFTFAWLDVFTVAVAAVLLAVFLAWLYGTRAGSALLAVAENPTMAEALGISLPRARLTAMVVGTALSAPAAILGGFYQSLSPGMGATPLFIGFAAVLVGGAGSIAATLLGVAVLEFVSAFAGYWLPGQWSLAITFGVVLAFMLWRPRGLLSSRRRATAFVGQLAGAA